jgi:hypothetical protein
MFIEPGQGICVPAHEIIDLHPRLLIVQHDVLLCDGHHRWLLVRCQQMSCGDLRTVAVPRQQ